MKYYTSKQVSELLDKLNSYEPEIYEFPGSLLNNYLILPTEKTKGFIIKEIYLNEWSSTYNIRAFTKISKRIEKIIKEYSYENYDTALELFLNNF